VGDRLRGNRRGRASHGAGRAGKGERESWIYGRRPVIEVLLAGRRQIHELRMAATPSNRTDDELAVILDEARRAGIAVRSVPRDDLEELTDGGNHQGVAIRTSSYPYAEFDQILETVRDDPAAIVLLLDHIEDPQNVGSLLRTADAAGVAGVVIPNDRAASVTSAVVRASAGASEHVSVARVVNLGRAIGELKACECWITGLDVGEGARPYTEVDFKGRCGLVVGNEGRGLGRLIREQCDFIAELPMRGQVSSLNAGVAGALVLYEVLRQHGVR
jgi:23S rRNA (guanosine2251-2'-O)-methyltransferase